MRTGASVGLNTEAVRLARADEGPLYCAGSQWISKVDDDVALRSAAAD